jgi:hypothetical protein
VSNAKFWLFNVLQKNGFQAIRSFINQSDKTRATEKDKKFYGCFILQNSESHNALHVAAKEQNGDLFYFLLGSVLSHKKSNLMQIQNLLLSKDEKGSTMIYNYFLHCEISGKLLDELLDLGCEFVKKVMMVQSEIGNGSENSVIGASRHGGNILTLLNWTLDNYSKDSGFLESVFGSVDSDEDALLHVAGQCSGMTTFLDLLDIFVRYKKIADKKVFSKILAQKNKRERNFLMTLTQPWTADCIEEVLDRIRKLLNSDEDLEEFLKITDDWNYSFLHHFTHFRKKQKLPRLFSKLVKWMDREFSRKLTEEILEMKTKNGGIFLHLICENDEENQCSDSLIAILDFLKNEFCVDEMFLKKLIFKQADSGYSILHFYSEFCKKENLLKLFTKLMLWLGKEFGTLEVEKFLGMKNQFGNTFLASIFFENDDGSLVPDILIGILDFLRDDLKLDPSFLLSLVLNTDKDGDSILHFYALACSNKLNFFKLLSKLFPWIERNYSLSTLKNFILLKDSRGQNFLLRLFFLYENGSSRKNFSVEALEAFLKILSFCFELFDDKEMILEILNSEADRGQTLRKYVEENCAKNGFDESLKSFNQILSEKSIEQEIVSEDLAISESSIETDQDVDE